MVLIVPSDVTFRITELERSAIYRFPPASMASPVGLPSEARVAGPLSPE